MIDTDKYEGTNWDLKGQFTHTEMADEVLLLLAEVERLREESKWLRDRLCRHIGHDYCKSEYEKHFGREMIE